MDRFVAQTSKHGVFRSDIITTLRANDSIIDSLEEIFKYIAEQMSPEIEYLGKKQIDERIEFPENYVQLRDSVIECWKFNFKLHCLTGKGEPYEPEIPIILEVPTLINGKYYYINGNRFYPIYHLLDATTFTKRETDKEIVSLKTLSSHIALIRQQVQIKDTVGNCYDTYVYFTELQQKKRVNLFIFFFATLGFFTTISYFEGGCDCAFIHVVDDAYMNAYQETTDRYRFFQITKTLYLRVLTRTLTNKKVSPHTKGLIATILNACKKTITLAQIRDVEYWRYNILASTYFKSKTATRNAKIDLYINLFKRLYDPMTKKRMQELEEPKEDIYAVLRWMFYNFASLFYRKNHSVVNKRIRLSESLVEPIFEKMLGKMYRVFKSGKRERTPDRYVAILTMQYKYRPDSKSSSKSGEKNEYGIKKVYPSDILVKNIINSNIVKYADSSNDLDLFNIYTRFTINRTTKRVKTKKKGGKSFSSVSKDRRSRYINQLGVFSLNATGAGDPGASGCFTPFTHIYKGGYFRPANNDTSEEEE
jgi:hypothetical protein